MKDFSLPQSDPSFSLSSKVAELHLEVHFGQVHFSPFVQVLVHVFAFFFSVKIIATVKPATIKTIKKNIIIIKLNFLINC
jgi:hypothetical protein